MIEFVNYLKIVVVILCCYCATANNVRHRHRKQAVPTPNNGGTLAPRATGTDPRNLGAIQWPGQENSIPYISQWGAWTEQQLQQGSGQKFVQSGIQISPAQAQWYPNSPEYQGYKLPGQWVGQPVNNVNQQQSGQYVRGQWQQGQPQGQQQQGQPPQGQQQQQWPGQPQEQQRWPQGQPQGQQSWLPQSQPLGQGQQMWQSGSANGQQQWQQAGQPIPTGVDPNYVQTKSPSVIYWPPPNTTVAPVQTWGTWADVKQQGAIGGMMSQWQNWYMNPDVWAQWQEWLVQEQRRLGSFTGPDDRNANLNQTAPDDTYKILVDLLAGFVGGTYPRSVAMYNAKTYYPQYRRDYWIGLRYYPLDPLSKVESAITCIYDMPKDVNVLYEIDSTKVKEIVFQCVKLQETCCKLNCCDMEGHPLYYASWLGASSASVVVRSSIVQMIILLIFSIYSVIYL